MTLSNMTLSLSRHIATAWLLGLLLCGPSQAQNDSDVPFITTPDRVTLAMLRLAQVGPRDKLLDLGSGDGRIVITAALRFGAQGLGVEIVPELVTRSRETATRAGVASRAEFREQDLFKTDLSGASVITLYLLPEVNLQLRPALLALKPGTRIVSHDWDMGDWAPDRTLTLAVPEKTIGREKLSRLHLWHVPAPVAGLWCTADGRSLRLNQQFQQVQGTLDEPRGKQATSGRLSGATLRLQGLDGQLQVRWHDGQSLQVVSAQGRWKPWRGQRLHPSLGAAACI